MAAVLIVAAWIAVALLLVHALYGPSRWYYAVTVQVRPHTAMPTSTGRGMLIVRNWVLVAAALVVALPLTLDRRAPDEDELAEAVEDSVQVISPTALSEERLEAELRDRLDTDEVSVGLVLPGGGSRTRTLEPGVPLPDVWEVRLGAYPDDGDDERTSVCVAVESTYDGTSDDPVVEMTGVTPGACD